MQIFSAFTLLLPRSPVKDTTENFLTRESPSEEENCFRGANTDPLRTLATALESNVALSRLKHCWLGVEAKLFCTSWRNYNAISASYKLPNESISGTWLASVGFIAFRLMTLLSIRKLCSTFPPTDPLSLRSLSMKTCTSSSVDAHPLGRLIDSEDRIKQFARKAD